MRGRTKTPARVRSRIDKLTEYIAIRFFLYICRMNWYDIRKYEIDKRDQLERERMAMDSRPNRDNSPTFLVLFGVALIIAAIALLTYVIAGIVTGNIW